MDSELKKILIITNSGDETVSYIVHKYNSLADFIRINVDKFDCYQFGIDNVGWYIEYNHMRVTDDDIYSIYYRKPMFPSLHLYQARYHSMIQRDIISVVNGIADSFLGKVLSKPSILRKTENKVYQLIYASKHGWRIPKSYIGNDIEQCNEFENDLSIIKPLTTGKTYGSSGWELYQTNLFKGLDADISLTPLYLQQYIQKQYEARLTIIEKNVYCVRIDTQNKIDWRADYQNHKYSLISCPDIIVEKCMTMMSDFELQFGAFDFIVTPQNQWVFLELNPNGQWLWLEESLELDISRKIVEYLCT